MFQLDQRKLFDETRGYLHMIILTGGWPTLPLWKMMEWKSVAVIIPNISNIL